MKILITTVFFPPQNAIASQRPYVWAREWSKAGHDVSVLTICKDAEKGDLSVRPFTGFRVVEVAPGPLITRLRRRRANPDTGPVAAPSRFRAWLRQRGFLSSVRLPDVFDFWIPSARRALDSEFPNEEFDIIISTFGPHASLRVGYHASKRWPQAKWILDFRDLWTANHVYPGFGLVRWIERVLEKFYFRHAEALTTVSPALAEDLASTLRRYGLSKPVEVFTNGYDPEEMPANPVAPDLSKRPITLVYTGSLHPTQRNPEPLLLAVAQLTATERTQLRIVFAGPKESFLERRVRDLGIADTVILAGSLKRNESLALQGEAAVLLFFETQHEKARDGVLTGKLFEYLATGRPVWAIGIDQNSTVGSLLTQSLSGVAFGNDTAKLVQALRALTVDGPALKRDTTNPADVVNLYDRNVIANAMLKKFETWLANGSARPR